MRRAIGFLLCMLIVSGLAGCLGEEVTEPGIEPGPRPSANGSPAAGGGDEVLMLGRSVMGGWMSHWGDDGSRRVEQRGHTLRYEEIDVPDNIAPSAVEKMSTAGEGSVVFFKFCFDDFSAGDPSEAATILARNQQDVRTVAATAKERGLRLIVGNALPKTSAQTTPELARLHRDFNAWLEKEASEEGFAVFDFYSVLAADDGSLKSEYATSPDDSHPNDAAYSALDDSFFQVLEEASR